jgi:hypothetical protein
MPPYPCRGLASLVLNGYAITSSSQAQTGLRTRIWSCIQPLLKGPCELLVSEKNITAFFNTHFWKVSHFGIEPRFCDWDAAFNWCQIHENEAL